MATTITGKWTGRTYTIEELQPGYWGHSTLDAAGKQWWNTQRYTIEALAALDAECLDIAAAAAGDDSDLDLEQFEAECARLELGEVDPDSYAMTYGEFWFDPTQAELTARLRAQQALCRRHRRWLKPIREAEERAKAAAALAARREAAAARGTFQTTLRGHYKADANVVVGGVAYRVAKAERTLVDSSFSYPGIGCRPDMEDERITICTLVPA